MKRWEENELKSFNENFGIWSVIINYSKEWLCAVPTVRGLHETIADAREGIEIWGKR